MRPLGTQASPRITISFSEGGKTYRLEKQYLDGWYCKLSDGSGKQIAQGSKAEDELQRIIKGSKGASGRDKSRGICQALWFLQDDEPTPKDAKAWADEIRDGLSRAAGNIPSSPDEKRIRAGIASQYKIYFNSSGSEKAKSPVLASRDEIDSLDRQITDLEGKKLQLGTLLSELSTTATNLDTERLNLSELMKRYDMLKATVSKGEALGKNVQVKELTHNTEDNLRAKLAETDARVGGRLDEIDELERQKEQKKQAVADQERAAAQHQVRAEVLKEDVGEIRAKQAIHDSALAILRPLMAYRQTEKRLAKLRADKHSSDQLQAEIQDKEAALRGISAPSRKELEEIRSKKTELMVLEARVKAQSVLVKFLLRDVVVQPEPNAAISEEGEFIISQPTTFTLGDLGSVSVRGHEVLDEELQNITSLRRYVSDALVRYRVNDIDQLNTLAEARAMAESEIENKRSMLSCSPKIPQEELDSCVRYLEKLREALINDSDTESLTDGELEDRIKFSDSERARLDRDLEQKNQKMNDESERYQQALESKNNIISEIGDLDGRMASLREENKKELRDFGGIRDELKQALAMKTEQVRGLLDELEVLRKQYKDQFDGPKAEMELLEADIIRVNGEITRQVEEKAGIGGQIRSLTDDDVLDKLNILEEKRDEIMEKMLEERRHSDAVKLLNELVSEVDSAQSAALSGPIKSLVDKWLATLTNGGHTEVHIDDGLYPLKVDSGQDELELERLSRGTKEQIDVLTRLAVGVLSAQNERNLVVIDDRLVNSDPTRMQAMCQILDEVCDKCQLIMTTCDGSRFNSIPYTKVNLLMLP